MGGREREQGGNTSEGDCRESVYAKMTYDLCKCVLLY